MNTTTQKQNANQKPPNHQTKMVFNAFSPCGAPREPGRERYFFSLPRLGALLSQIGGENDAR